MKKKVLILCNDFPPLHSAGALRPFSWYRDLHNHDIYPVVITRHWPEGIANNEAKFTSHPNETLTSVNEEGSLIRAAFRPDLHSRLIARYGLRRHRLWRKCITLCRHVFGPFIHSLDEYRFLYREANRYLSVNRVDLIIATGSPFGLFKEASALSRKYGIPWMADYRDPFSFNLTARKGFLTSPDRAFRAFLEKKWTANALHFTTVSKPWAEAIGRQIKKKGTVIRNGYDASLMPAGGRVDSDQFLVTYLGTVYDDIYIDILTRGIADFLHSGQADKKKVLFRFVGPELNRTKGTDRLLAFRQLHPENMEVLPACPNTEALRLAGNSAVLLNLNYGRHNDGIIPVKLYEYMALNKCIISIEKRSENESHEFDGYLLFASDAVSFADHLHRLYQKWKNGEKLENRVDPEVISKYARSEQSRNLAQLIHQLLNRE